MYIHLVKHPGGEITASNYPINENGIDSLAYEVSEDQCVLVQEGLKDWVINDGVLSLKDSERKSKLEQTVIDGKKIEENAKTRKLELIEKVTSGEATKEEQLEFANLL